MMESSIGTDAAKLAGLQVDLLQKIRSGQVSMDHLEWFNGLTKEGRDQLVSGKGVVQKEFQIWKTVKLRTGFENVDGLRSAITQLGMNISDWANSMLNRPEFCMATTETEVDLVKVTVAELGFKNSARRDQIYDRVKELGLEICPPEVGPQLRLQYKDQPMNERLLIGMEPIRSSDGALYVFRVEHYDDGLWLRSCCGGPDLVWGAGRVWLFVRPRK